MDKEAGGGPNMLLDSWEVKVTERASKQSGSDVQTDELKSNNKINQRCISQADRHTNTRVLMWEPPREAGSTSDVVASR